MWCLLLACFFLHAQTNVLPIIKLEDFASGLDNPVDMEHAGDAFFYVVEQPGTIKVLNASGEVISVFLDISGRVMSTGFEQGLLGIAFDPQYATNGFFYVHYTNTAGNSQFSRFSRNPMNPMNALADSEVPLLEDDDPYENHNGGQMKFGPDGYLYFTIGDGGNAGDPMNNAQDITTILGKLMRIDPNMDGTYSIPGDNPYAGVPGARPEIWATGLRNPWRFSFDKLTGDLWIPDVGQDEWEEVNYVSGTGSGANYGWSCMEALHPFKTDCDNNGTPFTSPIAEYGHTPDPNLDCLGSITGGYIYRGSAYSNMYGKYIYNDFCTGVMRTTYWNGSNWTTAELGNFQPFAYSSFGEDINGELYLVNKTDGEIYRITDESIPVGLPDDIKNEFSFTLSPNPNPGKFSIQFESDKSANAKINILDMLGRNMLSNEKEIVPGINQWSFTADDFAAGRYVFRLQTPTSVSAVQFVIH